MGLLHEGKWVDQWYDTGASRGRFVRQDSAFRNWVSNDGSTPFAVESNRYRLFVSYACPWAHRTLIFRALKKLEAAIDVSVVDPVMGEKGWIMDDGKPLHTLYSTADATYIGRVTVPVLWDTQTSSIVNNESSDIIRMLNRQFSAIGGDATDYYPKDLTSQIERLNNFVYHNVNNGVYRAGFATTQDAYEEAVSALFAALDELEERLKTRRYLLGSRLTEADWRLFTTLVRFDAVYVGHFKCNIKRLVDYPNLWAYSRDLYQTPGVAETVNFDHIKRHYYMSHPTINPSGVVPTGPDMDFSTPHGRDFLGTNGQ